MEAVVAEILGQFEQGTINRRQLIQGLAALVTPSATRAFARSVASAAAIFS
jgi:hypothetical protein